MEHIKIKIFGDFQTPLNLVEEILNKIQQKNIVPQSIIEPTCGLGNFLKNTLKYFPTAQNYIGLDINQEYLQELKTSQTSDKITLYHDNFFNFNWNKVISSLPEPLLIIGNPPWVTNTMLGGLGADNLPHKHNFQNLKGLDALTGKSNFDICETIILEQIKWLEDKKGIIAMICKTSTARKIILSIWKNKDYVPDCEFYEIDALKHFSVSVDACVLFLDFHKLSQKKECIVYENLRTEKIKNIITIDNNFLVYNKNTYQKHIHLMNHNSKIVYWRSGLKHDCSKIMELEKCEGGYKNGYGQYIELEDTYIYPLYKSSDLNKDILFPRKCVIVPQKNIQDSTDIIKINAPKTYNYLHQNKQFFDNRKSVIYKNKDPFCIFGIGDYSFLPWKIAISGFDKKLRFRLISPINNKPCMFDDTVSFISFDTQEKAKEIFSFLQTQESHDFLDAMIFWDNKRPITIDILKRLCLPMQNQQDLFLGL